MGNLPMKIPAGFVLVDSDNAASGRYTGGDQVRFERGKPEKRAGWLKLIATVVLGKARALIAWVNFGGNTNISIGTNLKLYALLGGADTLSDITPIRETGTLADPFAITNGSAVVTVTDTSHGLETDAFVKFSGATAHALIDRTLGANIGDMTGGGGLAAAFDGTTSQTGAASASKAAATSAYVGKTLGTPAPISRATVHGSNDYGFVDTINPTMTLTLRGKNGAAPSSPTDGTAIGTLSFADTANESGGRTIPSTDTTTIWDHVFVQIAHDGAANTIACAELVLDAYFLVTGEYRATKIDANSYSIIHSLTAKTTDATVGGAAVAYTYLINPGLESSSEGLGYGAGAYGAEAYGTARSAGIPLELRHWFLNEYGDDILALPSGGRLYFWDESTMTEAQVVTNSPSSGRAMFVTSERFIFVLGTTTPMTVQWPDQDDFTLWTPAVNNTANSRKLQVGSKLIAGTSVAAGVAVVWSDKALYLFQYDGSSIVYQSRVVADNAGMLGPKAFAVVNSTAYWMSGHDFHFYNGGVAIIPNAIDINDFIFRDIDPDNLTKTFCRYIEKYNEVMWVYCRIGSTEPNRYVAVSLDDFSWTTGTWNATGIRTCGGRFRPGDSSSLMVDGGGIIYRHDVSLDADGAALRSFLEFGGLVSMANGQQNIDIMGFIPDCERQIGVLTVSVYTKDRPNSTAILDQAVSVLAAADEIADIRVHGRHAGFTLESNVVGGDYRLGIPSLEIQDAGERR